MIPLREKMFNVWENNHPILFYLGKLLLLLTLVKIIFLYYNRHIIFSVQAGFSFYEIAKICKWCFLTDTSLLLIINLPILFLFSLKIGTNKKLVSYFIVFFFTFINGFVLILNCIDVVYFQFSNQRANGDLLSVIDNPFYKISHVPILFLLFAFMGLCFIFFIIWKTIYCLLKSSKAGNKNVLFLWSTLLFSFFLFLNKNKISPYLIPTYPLIEINNNALIISQNSAHTFIYSLFRYKENIPAIHYFSNEYCDSLYKIQKTISSSSSIKKNVVLFIMESVSFDFFNPQSKYYTTLPFFDSLRKKSIFFDNAFCYSHQSTKGILANLASVPTLTDIPLYHSSYINMPITKIGSVLQNQGYHSFFCIGDPYNNFGFAECVSWLGFDKYYSQEDIPNYKNLPSHPMGIHDEYVLGFMHTKIDELKEPFFAVNFNISTHYNFELPKNFNRIFPKNYTDAMKSMVYYDYSLSSFFEKSKHEKWFQNTVFIFCSDHWMITDDNKFVPNTVSDFRIPIIIYDPSNSNAKTDHRLATQFDIMPTILSYSGFNGIIYTHGNSLLDTCYRSTNFSLSKPSINIFQLTNNSYCLGYNIVSNQTDYLFNYKEDSLLKNNLYKNPSLDSIKKSLEQQVKIVLQKTYMQYINRRTK